MPRHGDGAAFGLGALSAGAIISVIAGTYKFGEAAIKLRKLYDVGGENDVFIRMIERVRMDLAEADRLLSLPAIKMSLSQSPEKVDWIRQTVTRCRVAMEEKAKLTESVRCGCEGGKWLSLKKRIWWVLEEKERLETRSMELAMCHLGLLEVINFLGPLEPLACCQPEGIYRQKERFYNEAQDYIQRYEIPQSAYVLDKERARKHLYDGEFERETDIEVDRKYRDTYEEPYRGYRSEERDYAEEEVDRNVREYETAEGDRVLEDTREFQSYDERPREYEKVVTREVREFEEEPREGEHEHRHRHHHKHHSSHHESSSRRGEGDEEDDIIIRRRIIKKHGHSSRL